MIGDAGGTKGPPSCQLVKGGGGGVVELKMIIIIMPVGRFDVGGAGDGVRVRVCACRARRRRTEHIFRTNERGVLYRSGRRHAIGGRAGAPGPADHPPAAAVHPTVRKGDGGMKKKK